MPPSRNVSSRAFMADLFFWRGHWSKFVANGGLAASPPRGPQERFGFFWVGGIQSAGAAGGLSLRSPRVPDARATLGRRRRGCMRTPRGPGADRALRSRAEESAGAVRGGAQACGRPSRYRQKQSPSRSEKEKATPRGRPGPESRAPEGHDKSLHAVKEETKSAPAGQEKRPPHGLGNERGSPHAVRKNNQVRNPAGKKTRSPPSGKRHLSTDSKKEKDSA
jgi:hypothetical protein